MIYIIGDTHGEIDHKKINNEVVLNACGGVFPDYVIILGDFGFIWNNDPLGKKEVYWLNWLQGKPWITLFVDGNHENHTRLNALPSVRMFGNEVGQVSDRIFHLKRGNIFTIENKTFFCMGGGMSIDKDERTPTVSWWMEEIPSYKEYFIAKINMKKYNNSVDYVLTHTCPYDILTENFDNTDKYSDPTCIMLSELRDNLSFKKWFFGHMHEDKCIGDKYICSYNIGHILI